MCSRRREEEPGEMDNSSQHSFDTSMWSSTRGAKANRMAVYGGLGICLAFTFYAAAATVPTKTHGHRHGFPAGCDPLPPLNVSLDLRRPVTQNPAGVRLHHRRHVTHDPADVSLNLRRPGIEGPADVSQNLNDNDTTLYFSPSFPWASLPRFSVVGEGGSGGMQHVLEAMAVLLLALFVPFAACAWRDWHATKAVTAIGVCLAAVTALTVILLQVAVFPARCYTTAWCLAVALAMLILSVLCLAFAIFLWVLSALWAVVDFRLERELSLFGDTGIARRLLGWGHPDFANSRLVIRADSIRAGDL